MSDTADRYRTIAKNLTAKVEYADGLGPDIWDLPSPCEGWSARDVLAHIVDTSRSMYGRLDATEPGSGAAAPTDDDQRSPDELTEQWRAISDDVATALEDPDRARKVISGGLGEMPWEQFIGTVLCADTLIHTWDFATATGQPADLDSAAVTAAREFLAERADMLRSPGGFGAEVEAPADADEATRLIAFSGRRVT